MTSNARPHIRQTRPATIADVEVLALSPGDLLLYLCLHASHRHGLGGGLRPLCDVSETIQCFRDEIDWAQVADVPIANPDSEASPPSCALASII